MPSDSSLLTWHDKVACHIGKGTKVSPKESLRIGTVALIVEG